MIEMRIKHIDSQLGDQSMMTNSLYKTLMREKRKLIKLLKTDTDTEKEKI